MITNKQNGKSDRDLILRGVVDQTKHEWGSNHGSNILISPRISWMKSSSIVQTGQPEIDRRFKTSCSDQIFARDLIQSDLGDLLKRNYDVEAYSLHWYDNGNLAVQIRMETMNSNSFLNAYNMALASVGILIQKGYLTRTGLKKAPQEISAPVIHKPVIKPITNHDVQPLNRYVVQNFPQFLLLLHKWWSLHLSLHILCHRPLSA